MAPARRLVLDRFLSKLCSYHLGADFFQFYIQTTDTDRGGDIVRFLI